MPNKILVVDDNAEMRELLELYFVDSGYMVTMACGGVEAMKAIEAECPDLLLTDIRMPDGDGIDLIKQIKTKAKFEGMPIIVLTANGDGHSHKAREAGANVLLRKPVQFDTLLDIVRELLKFYSRPK